MVTSRTAAADQRWLAQEGFDCVLLESMNADDIEALVSRWHKAARVRGGQFDLAPISRRCNDVC